MINILLQWFFGFESISELIGHFYDDVDPSILWFLSDPRSFLAFLTLSILVFLYYIFFAVKKPEFIVNKNTKFSLFVRSKIHDIHHKFWPTIWCFGPFGQTYISENLRYYFNSIKYEREILKMKDGGQIGLDWVEVKNVPEIKKKPLLLIIHSLSHENSIGTANSFARIAQFKGLRVVIMKNRGTSKIKLTSAKLTCFTDDEDVAEVVEHLKLKYPEELILGVGISSGGVILVRYLIQTENSSLIDAAFVVSVPWDLHATKESLEEPGLHSKCSSYIASSLLQPIKKNKRILKENYSSIVDFKHLFKVQSVTQFDEMFTIKTRNFATLNDYLNYGTLKGRLKHVKKPLLCLNSLDDFLSPNLPIDEVSKTLNVAMIVTIKGGHSGFMNGLIPRQPYLSERIYSQFLDGLLSLKQDIEKLFGEGSDENEPKQGDEQRTIIKEPSINEPSISEPPINEPSISEPPINEPPQEVPD